MIVVFVEVHRCPLEDFPCLPWVHSLRGKRKHNMSCDIKFHSGTLNYWSVKAQKQLIGTCFPDSEHFHCSFGYYRDAW